MMNQTSNYLYKVNELLKVYEEDFIFGPPLLELKERIESVEHSIAVVGQFSVGKSALLNALLGEEVLSARRVEATKVLTKIKTVTNDADKKVVLHFTDGRKDQIAIERLEELDQYTTFQGGEITNELTLVELFWPVSFLNDELTLVDTPGANSITEGAFKVTEEALEQAAAIIYLFNGQKGMDLKDYELLKSFTDRQKRVFIVATHVDGLTDDEWSQVESHVMGHLPGYVPEEERQIYPVSSLLALEGKLEKDGEKVQLSNIEKLEEALQHFMATASYQQASLRSINHDYQTIVEEIELEEASEEERQKIEEEQRQRRYDRLVAITQANYAEVERYGNTLLKNRLDQIEGEKYRGEDELKELERQYRRQITRTFKAFVDQAVEYIVSPTVLRKEYEKNEQKFNEYYKEWALKIEELNNQELITLENTIKKNDITFLKLLTSMKTEAQIDWQSFEQELKALNITVEKIQFEKEEIENLFEEHEEVVRDFEKKIEQEEQMYRTTKNEKRKIKRELNNEEMAFESRQRILGSAPKIEQIRKTYDKWWGLRQEVYFVDDDSKLRQWKKENAQLRKEYQQNKERIEQQEENARQRLEMLEDQLKDYQDKIEKEKDKHQQEVYEFMLSAYKAEVSAADEQAQSYAEIIRTQWKRQMTEYKRYEIQHVKQIQQTFKAFIQEVEEREIEKIRVI